MEQHQKSAVITPDPSSSGSPSPSPSPSPDVQTASPTPPQSQPSDASPSTTTTTSQEKPATSTTSTTTASTMPTTTTTSSNVLVPTDFVIKGGLHHLTEEQKKRAVFVKNISAQANLRNLSDFFVCCGDVERIVLNDDKDNKGHQMAVVVFDEVAAASTAALLGKAIIIDSQIDVFPYAVDEEDLKRRIGSQGSPINNNNNNNNTTGGMQSVSRPAQNTGQRGRSATSVVASLIAAGYVTGEKLIAETKVKAKELDNSIKFTQNVSYAYDVSSKKVKEYTQEIHLKEKINQVKASTSQSAKVINEKYEINKKATAVKGKAKTYTDMAAQYTKEYAHKAYEYPAVKTSVDYLWSGWTQLKGAIGSFYTETAEEVKRREQEKMKQQNFHNEPHTSSEGSHISAEEQSDPFDWTSAMMASQPVQHPQEILQQQQQQQQQPVPIIQSAVPMSITTETDPSLPPQQPSPPQASAPPQTEVYYPSVIDESPQQQ